MQTISLSLGQLVAALFDQYEAIYHDEELAALATQVELTDLLAQRDELTGDDEVEVAA